jgi:hypothetical protein
MPPAAGGGALGGGPGAGGGGWTGGGAGGPAGWPGAIGRVGFDVAVTCLAPSSLRTVSRTRSRWPASSAAAV